MSIDLPPVLPPELGTAEQVNGRAILLSAPWKDYNVHVVGNLLGDPDEIKEAIRTAETLSNTVRAIASLAYLAGYPGVRTVYVLAGKELYVMSLPGKVTDVHAPERYAGYFKGLVNEPVLTAAALEPRR